MKSSTRITPVATTQTTASMIGDWEAGGRAVTREECVGSDVHTYRQLATLM